MNGPDRFSFYSLYTVEEKNLPSDQEESSRWDGREESAMPLHIQEMSGILKKVAVH